VPLAFKATPMFQSRSFSFPLKNTSTARMDFRFTVCSADGAAVDDSGLYTVSPQGGVVPPGEEATITVTFSPTEVDECARLLVADIPHLAEGVEVLARQLNGKVGGNVLCCAMRRLLCCAMLCVVLGCACADAVPCRAALAC
jgi:hydrocephalus-inducing protein